MQNFDFKVKCPTFLRGMNCEGGLILYSIWLVKWSWLEVEVSESNFLFSCFEFADLLVQRIQCQNQLTNFSNKLTKSKSETWWINLLHLKRLQIIKTHLYSWAYTLHHSENYWGFYANVCKSFTLISILLDFPVAHATKVEEEDAALLKGYSESLTTLADKQEITHEWHTFTLYLCCCFC